MILVLILVQMLEKSVYRTGFMLNALHNFFGSGHRAVYVGVHVPFGKQGRRHHRHRGHKHHRRRKEKETDREDGRESPSYGKMAF